MSQAALAKAAECVTAAEISKAERGIKELTPEQLEAVAIALGVTPESLLDPASAAEEIPTDTPVKLTAEETLTDAPVKLSVEEREWLDLYRTADVDKRQLALCILKGTLGSQDLEKTIKGMYKVIEPAQLIGTVKNMILGSNVADLLAFAKNLMGGRNGKGLMSTFMGMSGSRSTGAPNGSSTNDTSMESGGNQNVREPSVPLLAFSYFYSVSIYILLLSFYFWQWRTDIKPEKW